jgi:diguanylate cyclase (GGDEF)-like protein
MLHVEQDKMLFYQALDKISDVQSAAEMLCAFLIDAAISQRPQCTWHIKNQDDISQTYTYPLAKTVQQAHQGAQTKAVKPQESHSEFVLVNASKFDFTLTLPDVEIAALESNNALQDRLNQAGIRIQHLLEASYIQTLELQLEKSQMLQKALFDISNLVYSEHITSVLYKKLHAIVASLVYAENFFIVNFNEAKQTLQFLYYADSIDKEPVDPDVEWDDKLLANSITLSMLKSKQYAWDKSQSLLDKFGLTRDPELGPESSDWLGIPMLDNGVVVGGLVVQSYLPDKYYTQADLNLLSFVAEHIHQSLSRRAQTDDLEFKVKERTAKLSQEIHERQRSEEIQSTLLNITRLATQSESLEQFYPAMHEIVGQLLEAKNIYVAFIDTENNMLNFPYYIDEFDGLVKSRPLSNGLTEWVLASKAPMLLNEAQIMRLQEQKMAVARGHAPKCWLGVPLIIKGKAVGVITLQSYDNIEAYSFKEQELLVFVSSHIAQALEKIEASNRLKQAYAEMETNIQKRTHELELSNQALREQIARREQAELKLKYDAMHDQLTGLANRNQLYISLKQSIAHYQANPNRLFAAFFIDLDRFKIINDSMGHWVGDELLKIVSKRIQSCLRKPDLVARLGGDEFAVILNSIRNVNEAKLVAERMLQVFTEPMYIQGKELFISPSIGIAISHERHQEPDEILRDSDIALYRSKELGRNRYTFFDDALHQSALNTLIIEGDLRRALTRNELFPFYQPLINLNSGKVLGFEALMRWNHPHRGLLVPSNFSDIAKETGLIEQIDWVIYEQVCRDLPVLLNMAEYASINVSPRHLGHEDFANRLLSLIAEYGIAPRNLNIEVTEDALIEHPELGLKLLTQLKQAGIRINLDDFGTGYSSFSYLHKYPLDCLKIDRSFLSTLANHPDNKTMHLVRAIHALGLSLGLDVIAEGVETADQAACLQQIGISLGQGNLFAKPAAIEDICKTFSQATV